MFYFVSKGYLKNYIYQKIVIPFSNSTKERGEQRERATKSATVGHTKSPIKMKTKL